MKKTEATNTFTNGLVMDLNPQQTPNDVLVNALNGTVITFQGNEKVLQNDMGNGRVETAFLPEKYIPLGTAELGGIIYVVSYNPLDNKCQIGSFPSPQRNLSTDKTTSTTIKLSANDFQKNEKIVIYYLKKTLADDLTFNPGDKFIVYGNSIKNNYGLLYNKDLYNKDLYNKAKEQTIKLELGTITSSGKLVKFSDLKEYNIGSSGKYFIFDKEDNSDLTTDIDEYRSLVSQPYNVFNSKVSGQLVLIAELIQFNSFNITIKHLFDNGTYTPEATYILEGEYPFIPYGVHISISGDKLQEDYNYDQQFNIDGDRDSFKSYEISNSFLSDEVSSAISKLKEGEKGVIHYTCTPCMNWGELSHLSIKGTIDLDKLGTGYINLNSWKYYVSNSSLNLNWGLDIYEEPDYNVTNVKMHLHRFVNESDIEETIYSINNKKSYNGIFYDILPLESTDYRLSQPLVANSLYFVNIEVAYSNESNTVYKHFYRWLYTNQVFNSYYYKDTITDYNSLKLDLNSDIAIEYNQNLLTEQKKHIYGILSGNPEEQEELLLNSKASLSGVQTYKQQEVDCHCTLKLKDSYNTFDLINTTDILDVTIEDAVITTNSTTKYTDEEDPTLESYLTSYAEITDNIAQYQLEDSVYIDVSDKLMIPTNVAQLSKSLRDWNFTDNTFNFKVDYSNLQLVKAACTKLKESCQYSGKMVPLAYDEGTFKKYNLIPQQGQNGYITWRPDIIGTFCLDDDKIFINSFTDEYNSSKIKDKWGTKVVSSSNPNLNWGTNTKIQEAEQAWRNTTMFSLHLDSGHSVYIKLYDLPYGENSGLIDDLKVFSVPLAGREFVQLWPNKRRLQLMVKGINSEYYYPIDFSYNTSTTIYTDLFTNDKTFFNDFAIILNNLYRYDAQGFSKDWVLPDSIFYMDKCTYSLNIPLSVKTTNIKKCSVKLQDSQILLSNVINKLKEKQIIPDGSIVESFNVTANISDLNTTCSIDLSNTDDVTGKALRDYILDLQTYNTNIAIMDYDGITLKGNINNAEKDRIYILSEDGKSIEPAINVSFKRFTYQKNPNDGSINISMDPKNILESGIENINGNFAIDSEGLLRLKYFRSGGHTTMNLVGAGKATGYQNVRLLNKYRVYS